MLGRAPFPEPAPDVSDPAELTLRHLEHLRGAAVAKVASLGAEERLQSRVPSGWTPLGLLWHLAHMERRWIEWGFLGEAVAEPWADSNPDGGWQLPAGTTIEDVAGRLEEQGERTRAVVGSHPWAEHARAGGRFTADRRPTLASICFHLVQEYSRHLGQLDVGVELAGGAVGEQRGVSVG